MRKKLEAEHQNHERWLVSYADFITLLFAFFVVMFATNQSDRSRAKQVSDSVRDALEHGQISSRLSNVLGKGKHDGKAADHSQPYGTPGEGTGAGARPADLAQSLSTLQRGLSAELRAGKLELTLAGRGLVIDLREAAFFASGDDRLSADSYPILAKIAEVIQGQNNQVRLEGYTDSIPIHNSRFRSNWELSAARAIAMLEALAGRYGVASSRMAVAGYGENFPVDTNQTEEGRSHNRRVAVVLLTQEAQRSEPASGVKEKS